MGLSCKNNLATAVSNGTINFGMYGIELKSTAQRWILCSGVDDCPLKSTLNKESIIEYSTMMCTCTSLCILLYAGCELLEMYIKVHPPPGQRWLAEPCQEAVPRHSAGAAWLSFVLTSAVLQSNDLTARLQRGLSGIMLLIAFVPLYRSTEVALGRWR